MTGYDPTFQAAVATVLEHEGGLVDDPADPGGVTNFGISLRAYPQLGADGIRALTRDKAIAIYWTDYWVRYRLGQIPGVLVPVKVMDLMVNAGPEPAAHMLQRALRASGEPVDEDGHIGPATIAAVRAASPVALLAALRSEAAGYYRAIVAAKPERSRFINGWLNRAYS